MNKQNEIWNQTYIEDNRVNPWEAILDRVLNGLEIEKITASSLLEIVGIPRPRQTPVAVRELDMCMKNIGWHPLGSCTHRAYTPKSLETKDKPDTSV